MDLLPLISLAIWGFCIWYCTSSMGSKGRSMVIGFILGFFLGLIGVLIVALLATKETAYGRYLR